MPWGEVLGHLSWCQKRDAGNMQEHVTAHKENMQMSKGMSLVDINEWGRYLEDS